MSRLPNKIPKEMRDILDLVPGLSMLPGEDALAYEDLRAAFLGELCPSSPYQCAIAENIVSIEWEAHRTRKMRDTVLRATFKELAADAYDTGEAFNLLGPSEEASQFADALTEQSDSNHEAALEIASGIGLDEASILAQAYIKVFPMIAVLERRLSDFELRRRRLREDLVALQRREDRDVVVAEVIDGDK